MKSEKKQQKQTKMGILNGKQSILTLLLSCTFLFGFVLPVSAQTTTQPYRITRDCRIVDARLRKTTNWLHFWGPRFETVADGVQARYQSYLSSIQMTNPTGYTTLQGYLTTMHTSYGDVIKTTDIPTFLSDLQTTDTMALNGQCGTSDGAYLASVQKLKADRQKLQTDVTAWKGYYTSTIAPYIQSLAVTTTPVPTEGPTPTPTEQPGTPVVSAPVCTDIKPASAPVLLSAVVENENQVKLTWSYAADPVTYYLVAYGQQSGVMQYGNPNVGDKTTNSYLVSGLSGGTTYYFTVRAGNNCMPGDFSNEIAATPTGQTITQPATGFESGVLSATQSAEATVTVSPTPSLIATSAPATTQHGILSFITTTWEAITHFFSSIFFRT